MAIAIQIFILAHLKCHFTGVPLVILNCQKTGTKKQKTNTQNLPFSTPKA